MRRVGIGVLLALGMSLGATSASAGDYSGDTLVRVQGTLVAPDSSADVNVPAPTLVSAPNGYLL